MREKRCLKGTGRAVLGLDGGVCFVQGLDDGSVIQKRRGSGGGRVGEKNEKKERNER